MLVVANTSFFERDSEITNHFDILINYFKTKFIPDVISLTVV